VQTIEMATDHEITGNSANTLGTVEMCYEITCPSTECSWAGISTFDGIADYTVDVVVWGDTSPVPAPTGYALQWNYDDTKVHIVDAGSTDLLIKTPTDTSASPPDWCLNQAEVPPDSDGSFEPGCVYLGTGIGTPGNGTLARLGLDIGASGLVTFSLGPAPFTSYASEQGIHDVGLVPAQLAINQDCAPVQPTPTPGTPAATPAATPTATPPPTPPPGTIMLVSGWNNPCYVGPEQPIEDALADVADHVLAVYRMRADQGFDRWFPNRPEASNITTLSPYQPLFILMGQYAFWPHEPSGTPPPSVSLASGWNSVCYTGQTKSAGDATAGVAGGFVIMYQLGSNQGWSRYVPARPEMSNIAQLSHYDTVLMLVDQEGGTNWTLDP
jgi:hypothetical protein